jgi:hypothetical protein
VLNVCDSILYHLAVLVGKSLFFFIKFVIQQVDQAKHDLFHVTAVRVALGENRSRFQDGHYTVAEDLTSLDS